MVKSRIALNGGPQYSFAFGAVEALNRLCQVWRRIGYSPVSLLAGRQRNG